MRPILIALAACAPLLVHAQSLCASDGQPRPATLYERFISADCAACWAAPPAPAPGPTALVIDWIVPTAQGDDAPLSAAATREALERLSALGRPAPAQTATHITDVPATPPGRLRLAHGPAVSDYLGTGIRFTPTAPAAAGPYQFTLLLVESLPAGAEDSPIARNVARNGLQGMWDKRNQLSKKEQWSWMENRSMRIPEGARPERLRLVGLLHDAQGHLRAAAMSRCLPEGG